MAPDLFGLEQQQPRTLDRKEAAALVCGMVANGKSAGREATTTPTATNKGTP